MILRRLHQAMTSFDLGIVSGIHDDDRRVDRKPFRLDFLDIEIEQKFAGFDLFILFLMGHVAFSV
ncbi:MAG: hypothetical protein HUJ51_00185 [Eggerthellaceae bacterium]|nr:hypothetical protein [Eggerthellaceae bacterium]